MFESGLAARAALAAAIVALPLCAQDEGAVDSGTEPQPTWSDFIRSLDPQAGAVTVQGGKATIELPDGWHYLHPQGARRIVEDLWGNPPDASTLGLVLPPGFEAEDEGTPTWAIIVSYDDEGHVPDDDAATIDYDELLTAMQDDTAAANAERRKRGYEEVEIVGWAERPHYDGAEKKLFWARHLRFSGPEGVSDTLNYDIRILGRRGTLTLRAVAGVDELETVREHTAELLPRVDFVAGERYADYQEGVDPLVVGGGIGALIAGKMLAKGGLLKLLAGLWKPIAVGAVALVAVLGRVLGRRKSAGGAPA